MMKNKEIAARIDAHLKRFENDPEINANEQRHIPLLYCRVLGCR
jgi:hypothetical protein